MPKPLKIVLSEAERRELEQIRDRGKEPYYVRERAAAILKIAAGQSGRDVALHGLLKKRSEDTVYRWYQRYQQEKINGLKIRKGRGRKPAFSPSVRG
jgi:transposase